MLMSPEEVRMVMEDFENGLIEDLLDGRVVV